MRHAVRWPLFSSMNPRQLQGGAPDRAVMHAHAKVNLSLDVGPRLDTGYHTLRTVMQTVSLADTVEVQIAPGPGVSLICTSAATGKADPEIPQDHRNTAYQAAVAALERSRSSVGVRIRIVKSIPSQAGLGGGSSDAAAVLRAVARLIGWQPRFDELRQTAIGIGSDVPFFLTGGTALVEGIGESVTPVADAPALDVVVARPDAGVSTAQAYRALDERPSPRSANTPEVLEALNRRDRDALLRSMGNHFERVIPGLVPGVAALMQAMGDAGASPVRLCGSGSAVFGVAKSASHAQQIAAALGGSCPYVAVATTIGAAASTTMETGR